MSNFKRKGKDFRKLREKAISRTKKGVAETKKKRDNLIVQTVKAIDLLDKTTNSLLLHLKDWYSFYFPELARLVEDPDEYALLVTELQTKDNFSEKKITDLLGKKKYRLDVEHKSKHSMGADIDKKDLEKIIEFARKVKEMRDKRKELEVYLERIMKEEAPNITAVIGVVIGARLISTVGSLKRLSQLPSSTVQVLGAEKALFAHIRKGVKPPKHGIIFQYPMVKGSPLKKRGKIARKVASKVSIAAKIDFFKGEFIGDKLKAELEANIKKILKVKK